MERDALLSPRFSPSVSFQLTRSRGAWLVTVFWIVLTSCISTHTLTWSVTLSIWVNALMEKNFNSHAHVERDQVMNFWLFVTGNFNSHAHVERDLQFCTKCGRWWISTHTLTWSVTSMPLARLCCLDYFNSHAHVERDYLTKYFCSLLRISTHTLTWSVTQWFCNWY